MPHDPAAIERLFVMLMMEAHGAHASGHPKRHQNEAPRKLIIDLDATHKIGEKWELFGDILSNEAR